MNSIKPCVNRANARISRNPEMEKADMIQYRKGNIFNADVEALVNPVNCVGIMGRGLAAHFKIMFPGNFKAYAKACKNNELRPGRLFVYDRGWLSKPRYIINFATKGHWRDNSRMTDIETGLGDLVVYMMQKTGIESIAIPALGCGLGGLQWADVKPRIEQAMQPVNDVQVFVYESRR